MAEPPVNITVVTNERLALTTRCLTSLFARTSGPFHLTCVDNGSTDGTPAFLTHFARRHDNVTVYLLGRNMGVAVAANLGWASRDTPYYVKLDNDMEIEKPDWLSAMLGLVAANPELGLVGYKFCPWHATVPDRLGSGDTFLSFAGCGGGCVLIPKTTHERLGFWNEDYGRYGYEDLDYGNRAILLGLRTGYVDDLEAVRHLGREQSVSPAREAMKRQSTRATRSGRALYLVNKFLFENGIRPLYVRRKYVARTSGGAMTFGLDPAAKGLMRLQSDLLRRVPLDIEADTVRLDLSAFLHRS